MADNVIMSYAADLEGVPLDEVAGALGPGGMAMAAARVPGAQAPAAAFNSSI